MSHKSKAIYVPSDIWHRRKNRCMRRRNSRSPKHLRVGEGQRDDGADCTIQIGPDRLFQFGIAPPQVEPFSLFYGARHSSFGTVDQKYVTTHAKGGFRKMSNIGVQQISRTTVFIVYHGCSQQGWDLTVCLKEKSRVSRRTVPKELSSPFL